MKKCSKCKEEKLLEEFSFSSSKGRQSWCKKCSSLYRMKKYYDDPKCHREGCKRRRKEILDMARALKMKCLFCSEDETVCLDFHHKEPSKKDFSIANCKWGKKKMTEEINKCVVVCSNCHRKLHAGILVLETASEVTGITNQHR